MTHPGEVNGGTIKLRARYVLKLPVGTPADRKSPNFSTIKTVSCYRKKYI